MTDYTVKWEINIEADSAEDAARQALEIQRDPESQATVFEVHAGDPDTCMEQYQGSIDLGHQPLVRCEQHHNALIVCNRLIQAYTKASEDFGGDSSIRWEDIDDAHSLAHVTADHSAIEEIERNVREDQLGEDT